MSVFVMSQCTKVYMQLECGSTDQEITKNTTVDQHIPIPYSFIKRVLKAGILPEVHQNCYTSDNGRRTYDIIHIVFRNLLKLTPYTASFRTYFIIYAIQSHHTPRLGSPQTGQIFDIFHSPPPPCCGVLNIDNILCLIPYGGMCFSGLF